MGNVSTETYHQSLTHRPAALGVLVLVVLSAVYAGAGSVMCSHAAQAGSIDDTAVASIVMCVIVLGPLLVASLLVLSLRRTFSPAERHGYFLGITLGVLLSWPVVLVTRAFT